MKGILLALLAWTLLILAALWAALGARDSAVVEEHREQESARFVQIPWSEFNRDHANVLTGQVVDGQGEPLAGAEVEVYSTAALRRFAAGTEAGVWPDPVPEVTGRTGPEGEYRFSDLEYGSKLVVFRKEGFLAAEKAGLPFADGYGASGIDGQLGAVEPLSWTLQHTDGSPVAGVAVRFLPRSWAAESAEGRTGDDGSIEVPAQARSTEGEPRLLVGEPPILWEARTDTTEVVLPEASDLELDIDGAADGPVVVLVLPEDARKSGAWLGEAQVRDGRAVLPGVFHGRYELFVEQGSPRHSARADLVHDGSVQSLALRPQPSVQVRAVAPDGQYASFQASWQSAPFDPGWPFTPDPLAAVESGDPTQRLGDSGEAGAVTFEDLPFAGGHILVEAPHFAPVTHRLEPGQAVVEVELPESYEISIRSDRAYLPVRVEADGQPAQVGRTNAAAEAFALVPAGPVFVRSGFRLGGHSYPKGYLAGIQSDPLEFNVLDDRGRPRGCVCGFVLDEHGHPAAKAEVLIQGSTGFPDTTKTDEFGFYRFTALESDVYQIFALPPGDFRAFKNLAAVQLLPTSEDEQGEAIQNLTYYHGGVVIPGGVPPDAWVEFLDEQDQRVWNAEPNEKGAIKVANMPPGQYRLIGHASEDDPGWELATVEVAGGHTELTEVRWEGQQ